MRLHTRYPVSLHRRLQVWLMVGVLLGAQMMAAWHGVAHANRLGAAFNVASAQSQSIALQSDAQAAPAEYSLSTWGHEEEGSWRCRALDHALSADAWVPDCPVVAALEPAQVAFEPLRLQHPHLSPRPYLARAPPLSAA